MEQLIYLFPLLTPVTRNSLQLQSGLISGGNISLFSDIEAKQSQTWLLVGWETTTNQISWMGEFWNYKGHQEIEKKNSERGSGKQFHLRVKNNIEKWPFGNPTLRLRNFILSLEGVREI